MSAIEALRDMADVAGRRRRLEQFRDDFALVHDTERAYGYVNEDEAIDGRRAAGEAVREHLGDEEWIAIASGHYHEMAEAIRRDRACSERIASEVRAERMRDKK